MDTTRKVTEIMTTDVVVLHADAVIEEARRTFAARAFHHLPVVQGGRLVGMVSARDMALAAVLSIQERRCTAAATRVREVMSTSAVKLTIDDTLATAAERMLNHGVGALPVVDREERLVGIVSQRDLLREIASSR
jgi:acetoin utilization protein AcuB